MNQIYYLFFFFFFCFLFNDTATTEIYTLSLHDALPISLSPTFRSERFSATPSMSAMCCWPPDRKSTRLNSSHANISYAVFCLQKTENDLPPIPESSSTVAAWTLSTRLACSGRTRCPRIGDLSAVFLFFFVDDPHDPRPPLPTRRSLYHPPPQARGSA